MPHQISRPETVGGNHILDAQTKLILLRVTQLTLIFEEGIQKYSMRAIKVLIYKRKTK